MESKRRVWGKAAVPPKARLGRRLCVRTVPENRDLGLLSSVLELGSVWVARACTVHCSHNQWSGLSRRPTCPFRQFATDYSAWQKARCYHERPGGMEVATLDGGLRRSVSDAQVAVKQQVDMLAVVRMEQWCHTMCRVHIAPLFP